MLVISCFELNYAEMGVGSGVVGVLGGCGFGYMWGHGWESFEPAKPHDAQVWLSHGFSTSVVCNTHEGLVTAQGPTTKFGPFGSGLGSELAFIRDPDGRVLLTIGEIEIGARCNDYAGPSRSKVALDASSGRKVLLWHYGRHGCVLTLFIEQGLDVDDHVSDALLCAVFLGVWNEHPNRPQEDHGHRGALESENQHFTPHRPDSKGHWPASFARWQSP